MERNFRSVIPLEPPSNSGCDDEPAGFDSEAENREDRLKSSTLVIVLIFLCLCYLSMHSLSFLKPLVFVFFTFHVGGNRIECDPMSSDSFAKYVRAF